MGMHVVHFGFLAAGLAVAVPLIIHLLFRPKTRTVDIGSIRFLQHVLRSHQRRRRVQQWLLLTLRMLAVALLALLFSRPYWNDEGMSGTGREEILLVDGSASMQATDPAGRAAFRQMLTTVQEELSQIAENSIVHIGLCDASGVRPWNADKLTEMRPSSLAADWEVALSWTRDRLNRSTRPYQRVTLFTDLQKTGTDKLRRDLLPANVDFRVRDCGATRLRNLAVEAAQPVRLELRPDQPFPLRVTLHNYGPLAARDQLVRCSLRGPDAVTVEETVKQTVAGRQAVTFDLPLKIDRDGLYQGEVSIERTEDGWTLDDRRFLAFEARYPERVLLVDGDEGRSIFTSETYYLETALGVRADREGVPDQSFETERIVWEKGKGFPRLDGYRAVVLANVRRLSSNDAIRLRAYVEAGGSLIMFAGDQVERASLAPLEEQGLLPGTMVGDTIAKRLRVTDWDQNHPALACFQDAQRGDLKQIETHHAIPLSSLAEGSRRLLAAGSQILAAERSVGQGRSVYWAFSADRDWSELPRSPLYVPLMRQLMAYATGQLEDRSRVQQRTVEKSADQAGIVMLAGPEAKCVVTNLDPAESTLDRLPADDWYKRLGLNKTAKEDQNQIAAATIELPAERLREDEQWHRVVLALLVVLITETFVAGRVHV